MLNEIQLLILKMLKNDPGLTAVEVAARLRASGRRDSKDQSIRMVMQRLKRNRLAVSSEIEGSPHQHKYSCSKRGLRRIEKFMEVLLWSTRWSRLATSAIATCFAVRAVGAA